MWQPASGIAAELDGEKTQVPFTKSYPLKQDSHSPFEFEVLQSSETGIQIPLSWKTHFYEHSLHLAF
jgi:hypothetical protein